MQTNFKPEIDKKWLLLASGLLWSVAGIFLLRISKHFLLDYSTLYIFVIIFTGLFIGLLITIFGFKRIAAKNSKRILAYPQKVCIFAFQRWQMYLLIIFMMSLGFFLRTHAFFPAFLMAIGYIGIGSALITSSISYYKLLSKTDSFKK